MESVKTDPKIKIAVADTGFVVALANKKDPNHLPAYTLYRQIAKIILPQTTLVESAYLIGKFGGTQAVIHFLTSVPVSRYVPTALHDSDFARIAQLLSAYADTRIDFVDASVMIIAERLQIDTILTLDRRDFSIVRPKHCEALTLLP